LGECARAGATTQQGEEAHLSTLEAAPQFLQDQQPASVPLWLEVLAGLEWLTLRLSPVYWGCGVPRGDGSAVILVPGFLGSDWYLQELHCWLGRIGYRPYMSRIGRNADCLDMLVTRLQATVGKAHEDTGRRVHLIGHSLGGMLSRSAAALRPDRVASVMTLGSPFRGIRSHPFILQISNRVGHRVRLENRLAGDGRKDDPHCYTGYCGCDAVSAFRLCLPESISDIAVYTKTDGVVDWRFCINEDSAKNFEVPGTHTGLAFNPLVFQLIARQLAGYVTAGGAADITLR
jgi:pimeloyl-ACP methyl ester carboxylesterase